MKLHLRTRRTLALSVTAAASLTAAGVAASIDARLGHASVFTGATLLACLLLLMMIGVRKRLVMLPLLSVSAWVQIHIYSGLFATVVYLLHVPRIIASGVFEGGLSLLFLSVSASGLYGLFISRTAPRKLSAVPGEYRFDRIRWHRQSLAIRAAEVLREPQVEVASPVLAVFYRDALQPYLASGVSPAFLAVPNGLRRRRLLAALGELDRYLSDETRVVAGRLAGLIRTRDELDFHFAMQMRLRLWVTIHAVLSTVLLAWSCMHVVMVLSFI